MHDHHPAPAGTARASCDCGRVELDAVGAPIISLACYCADCQAGSRQIEALPQAGLVLGADGGTAYTLYRKDRIRCTRGAELLVAHRLKPGSATRRMAARCCNAAMFMAFDDSRHWVPVYQARLAGARPPLEMRICTRGILPGDVLDEVPSYPRYPMKFLARLLLARLAMLWGR